MPVKIHGKEYLTVAERLANFTSDHEAFSITTEILLDDGEKVAVRATVSASNKTSTGIAEEVRGSTQINRTSALENCETSAVGRALAFFGYAGTEIASANEVQNAIYQQENTFRFKKGEKEEVTEKVLQALSDGDEVAIKSVLHDYDSPEAKMAVWGLFNSAERRNIKALLSEDK